MMARRIIPLCGMVDGLAAVAVMARGFGYHDHAPLALPRHTPKTRLALEAEAKAILRGAGLPVPRNSGGLALGELAAAADDIGFPLVLKAEGLAHKTEAGGVALGITDRAAGDQVTICVAEPLIQITAWTFLCRSCPAQRHQRNCRCSDQ